MRVFIYSTAFLIVFSTMGLPQNLAQANETVSAVPAENALITEENQRSARALDRLLTAPNELSQTVRSVLGLPNAAIIPEAFGAGSHPFTTNRAGAEDSASPIDLFPWSPTGKLFMKFGAQSFVCTASVIGKNLLVTAAHCVHNFGQLEGGFASAITFEPARHLNDRPFGAWTAIQWWIPRSYFDGTDICLPQAPGVVCENDVAVVVLDPNDGKAIGDLTGRYAIKELGDDGFREFGYVAFNGQLAAELTQLGYPSKDYDGLQMIRTDSLGYQDEPNNVVIGSAQTGGSSGGPWLQNFGARTSFSGPEASDDDLNVVSAVTSWGFISGDVKVQGASRFGKNTTFTQRTNIQALIDDACAVHPDAC